jgi:adenylate cyclase
MFPVRRTVGMLILFCITFGMRQLSASSFQTDGKPFISKILINSDSVLSPAVAAKDREAVFGNRIVLSQRQNDISFEIADSGTYSYRFRLEGLEKSKTRWQQYKFKEYTNLAAGTYIFRAEWRNNSGAEGELAPVKFRVLPHWYTSSPAILIYVIIGLLLIWAFYDQLKYSFALTKFMLEQIINQRTEELIVEKEKTEKLLANVLPKNTADEIMSKGKATKIKYNFVTVLFSDIQGFTKIAEEMNPEVLIDELDKFFFHFDSVVEKYRIEKIKTIGDAYMCAGGIPEKNRTNPVEVILAALEMQIYMDKLKAQTALAGMKYWDIRIGIHTGTVVAGVVGQKKLSYDIWGDTVNTASRMESSGEAGKINISGTTYEFVKDFFVCEHRGKMPVKYKGEIDMYFVNHITDELREPDGRPNSVFLLKMQKIKLQDVEENVVKIFEEEAPPDLYFHNSVLMKNVCSQVDLFSNAEQLPDEEYVCLRLASIFLFTGYISDYNNAAVSSCRMAEEIIPAYGFTQECLDKTKKLIMNSFSGKTETITDMILYDSRYDYVGRVDYVRLTERLLKEELQYGRVTDRKAWIHEQKRFLSELDYKTSTGKLLRSIGKEEQAAALTEFAKEIK